MCQQCPKLACHVFVLSSMGRWRFYSTVACSTTVYEMSSICMRHTSQAQRKVMLFLQVTIANGVVHVGTDDELNAREAHRVFVTVIRIVGKVDSLSSHLQPTVILFQPKYWSVYPKRYLFLLHSRLFIRSEYPKNIVFHLKHKITDSQVLMIRHCTVYSTTATCQLSTFPMTVSFYLMSSIICTPYSSMLIPCALSSYVRWFFFR